MKKTLLFLGLIAGALGWAAAETGEARVQATTDTTKLSGLVTFEDTPKGLKITAQFENGPTGEHGFHIHEFGSCADSGNKAGSHYNPSGHPHGMVMKDGAAKVHPGDLGNISFGERGTGDFSAVIPGLSLSGGANSVAGRAVVVHAKADDFGQPTGNAGARIGCGVILITGK